ncbi:ATP-binding protein [Spongiactinospora rosea]|uniref:ATP-binding protein n=1 Tax=Spongiactinospora rosea TaxID=2248750 RepID=UPI0011C04FB2|nr:ATP-binding protein [Spongiactinospora rosea]
MGHTDLRHTFTPITVSRTVQPAGSRRTTANSWTRPAGQSAAGTRRQVVELFIACQNPNLRVQELRLGAAAHQVRAIVRQAPEDADMDPEQIADAEIAVAELAANAETHGRPPYELRIITENDVPVWCEVFDGDPELRVVSRLLRGMSGFDPRAMWFQESGRGLLMVHQLSGGRCGVYPATTCDTGIPGKAVGFALPSAARVPVRRRRLFRSWAAVRVARMRGRS